MSCVVTNFVYPPIPVRNWDWSATDEGYDPPYPIGYGPNEFKAVLDFYNQYEMMFNESFVGHRMMYKEDLED